MKKKQNSPRTAASKWPWPNSLDALVAAPESHKILLENKFVRVMEVTLKPGVKEPAHTHKLPSVMIVGVSTKLRYYDQDEKTTIIPKSNKTKTEWMAPEGLHAVENLDKTKTYHAIRIELKNLPKV